MSLEEDKVDIKRLIRLSATLEALGKRAASIAEEDNRPLPPDVDWDETEPLIRARVRETFALGQQIDEVVSGIGAALTWELFREFQSLAWVDTHYGATTMARDAPVAVAYLRGVIQAETR